MTNFDFKQLDAAFRKEAESCPKNSPDQEQEMYLIDCMANRYSIEEIDFSRFTLDAVDAAAELFEESIRAEDEDGTVRFFRDSAWATYNYMSKILWNFSRSETKKAVPPFPLI